MTNPYKAGDMIKVVADCYNGDVVAGSVGRVSAVFSREITPYCVWVVFDLMAPAGADWPFALDEIEAYSPE